MSSPVRHASSSQIRNLSNSGLKVEAPTAQPVNELTAFRLEFVAKPDQAAGGPLFLPAAIQSRLEDIPGFAGCLVMVSDQEARLITVIIFWSGAEARRSCERSVRRIRALLSPYMDRSLRVQNLLAHSVMLQNPETEAGSIDMRFIADESIAEEANVRVA